MSDFVYSYENIVNELKKQISLTTDLSKRKKLKNDLRIVEKDLKKRASSI